MSPQLSSADGCFADTEPNWATRQKKCGLRVIFSIVPQRSEERTPFATGNTLNEHHRIAT